MYTIRLGCKDCGRTFTTTSDTPKDQRVCPHPHGSKRGKK